MSAAFFFILLSYSWRRSSAEAMTGRPGRLQYAGDGGWRGVHVCSLKAFSNSSTYDCRMLQDLTKAISKGLVVKDSYGKLLLERSPVIPCPMQGMWLNIQTSQRNTAAFLCVGCGSGLFGYIGSSTLRRRKAVLESSAPKRAWPWQRARAHRRPLAALGCQDHELVGWTFVFFPEGAWA